MKKELRICGADGCAEWGRVILANLNDCTVRLMMLEISYWMRVTLRLLGKLEKCNDIASRDCAIWCSQAECGVWIKRD